jgi:hypothetical protein
MKAPKAPKEPKAVTWSVPETESYAAQGPTIESVAKALLKHVSPNVSILNMQIHFDVGDYEGFLTVERVA